MSKNWQRLLAVVVGIVVIGLAGTAGVAHYAVHHGQRFVQESAAAVVLLRSLDHPLDTGSTLAAAQVHWSAAEGELVALRPLIAPFTPYVSTLRHLPGVGVSLGDSVAVWDFAEAVTDLGDALLKVAVRGSVVLDTPHPSSGWVAELSAAYADLTQAIDAYERARLARAQIGDLAWLPPEHAAPLKEVLAQWDEVAPYLSQGLPAARDITQVLPALAGVGTPATYLVLLQTSDELRATGGFITGVGTIKIAEGVVTEVSLQKVTSAEQERPWQQGIAVTGAWVQPPMPLSRYMGLGHWALRDANWSADFPTSARQAAQFWQQEQGETVTGVLALNEQGLEQVLTMIGAVTLADGTVVTANTLKPLTLATVYQGEPSEWANRQGNFSTALASALLIEVERQWQNRLPQWIEQFVAERDKHNILFTVFDPTGAALLRQWGIDGALPSSTDDIDYLYVVEQNVSYNKLSPFIQQNFEYSVVLDTNARPLTSTLTLTSTNQYRNGQGWAEYPATYYSGGRWNGGTRRLESWQGYYGGFTSLYLLDDNRMINVSGFDDDPVTESGLGYLAVGGYIGLHPGEQQQVEWRWQSNGTPSGSGDYQLQIRYQPGASPKTMRIRVEIPPNYMASDIQPAPTTATQDHIVWELPLRRDEVVRLRLIPAGNGLSSRSTATPVATPSAIPSALATAVGPALPIRLEIPALTVDAPIVPVGLEPSGIMASPATAQDVAWYQLGARPGEGSNAVLAGHLDWKGEPGVFQRLKELQLGDLIIIESGTGQFYHYSVQESVVYDVDTAPLDYIFGNTTEDALTLITCTGPYDGNQDIYHQRLIIRAVKEE